jgi:hypothetical protein
MANPRLNAEELVKAQKLLNSIRRSLAKLSGGRADLLFAYRRKVYKELTYDERSKPMARRNLKALKRKEQSNRCAECRGSLPESYCVLDRLKAIGGYTAKNTRLICSRCDAKVQASRRYA